MNEWSSRVSKDTFFHFEIKWAISSFEFWIKSATRCNDEILLNRIVTSIESLPFESQSIVIDLIWLHFTKLFHTDYCNWISNIQKLNQFPPPLLIYVCLHPASSNDRRIYKKKPNRFTLWNSICCCEVCRRICVLWEQCFYLILERSLLFSEYIFHCKIIIVYVRQWD